ncbi:hypothetical protein KQX54_010444 [Cotesia glomerata]|uniref:Uncharacterized protein n=1 Tax=Cotesia glomerata TaxID=32391 RepID=A0AAV7IJ62_COTGL|nr:hypothetical protein KQX54_010444 [Cotesia glomerata]
MKYYHFNYEGFLKKGLVIGIEELLCYKYIVDLFQRELERKEKATAVETLKHDDKNKPSSSSLTCWNISTFPVLWRVKEGSGLGTKTAKKMNKETLLESSVTGQSSHRSKDKNDGAHKQLDQNTLLTMSGENDNEGDNNSETASLEDRSDEEDREKNKLQKNYKNILNRDKETDNERKGGDSIKGSSSDVSMELVSLAGEMEGSFGKLFVILSVQRFFEGPAELSGVVGGCCDELAIANNDEDTFSQLWLSFHL